MEGLKVAGVMREAAPHRTVHESWGFLKSRPWNARRRRGRRWRSSCRRSMMRARLSAIGSFMRFTTRFRSCPPIPCRSPAPSWRWPTFRATRRPIIRRCASPRQRWSRLAAQLFPGGRGRLRLVSEGDAPARVLGGQEVEAEVAAVIEELKPEGPKGFGMVMKAATARLAGRAEGQQVAAAARKLLGN